MRGKDFFLEKKKERKKERMEKAWAQVYPVSRKTLTIMDYLNGKLILKR